MDEEDQSADNEECEENLPIFRHLDNSELNSVELLL